MNERSLSAILGARAKPAQAAEAPAGEESEHSAFGASRVGQRPQLMLILAKADGRRLVLPYARLESIRTHDAEAFIELDFPGTRVVIEGRNLGRLLQLLAQNRCSEIRESADTDAFRLAHDEPLVASLRVSGSSPVGREG